MKLRFFELLTFVRFSLKSRQHSQSVTNIETNTSKYLDCRLLESDVVKLDSMLAK